MKPDTQRLLIIAALGGLGYGIYRMHASPKSSATSSLYPPGYYWAYVSQRASDQPAISKYFKDHKGKLFTWKTVSPGLHSTDDIYFKSDLPSSWILFEAREPFDWTLPGRPSPAPKGMATEIKDVVGDEEMLPAITSPEHPFNKFWGAFWSDGSDGKDPNPVLAVWSSLGTAGPLLVYGATGVLLFKLWTLLPSGKSPTPRRALPARPYRALPRG
jgi:hypothetical protein